MTDIKIKNWLALTKDNKYITIDKVTDNKQDYYCPCCKEVLRGRALESNLVQPHFYHLQNDNLNSCNYENAYKRYWKDNLITVGEIIKVPYFNDVTCIELKYNYKVNNIVADIYIRTKEDREILFLFAPEDGNYINLNYDVFYVNFMNLEFNKSNLYNCLELIHSRDIDNLNNKFKQALSLKQGELKDKITKDNINLKVDINKIKSIKDELLKVNYLKEFELISNAINLLENRQRAYYKYKGQFTTCDEVEELNKLIDKLINITKYNIDLDVNILKKIDYNIYKTKWNKSIYFDFIKPISGLLKGYTRNIENIIG